MAQIKITQVKSIIDRPKRQRLNMEALGLRKISASVIHNPTPQILAAQYPQSRSIRCRRLRAVRPELCGRSTTSTRTYSGSGICLCYVNAARVFL